MLQWLMQMPKIMLQPVDWFHYSSKCLQMHENAYNIDIINGKKMNSMKASSRQWYHNGLNGCFINLTSIFEAAWAKKRPG